MKSFPLTAERSVISYFMKLLLLTQNFYHETDSGAFSQLVLRFIFLEPAGKWSKFD